jgi:hypothetical protein
MLRDTLFWGKKCKNTLFFPCWQGNSPVQRTAGDAAPISTRLLAEAGRGDDS